MADDATHNIILDQLRAIRSAQAEHSEALKDLTLRMSSIEQILSGMHGQVTAVLASNNARDERIKRLETRAGLLDENA